MKKLFIFIINFAMICLIMAGCSKNIPQNKENSSHQSVTINEEEYIEEHGQQLIERYGEKLIELYGNKLIEMYEDEIVEIIYDYIDEDLWTVEPEPLLISNADKETAVQMANEKAAGHLESCQIQEHSVEELTVADGLTINIAKMYYSEKYIYYPTWCYYEEGVWNCVTLGWRGAGTFHTSETDAMDHGSSFVSKIGEYTIVYLSEYDFRFLSEDQFGDNLQTVPTELKYEPDEVLTEKDGWYCVMSDRDGNYCGTTVAIDTDVEGYIYVIKDMPKDYVFHCGEEMLTYEMIEQLLNPTAQQVQIGMGVAIP